MNYYKDEMYSKEMEIDSINVSDFNYSNISMYLKNLMLYFETENNENQRLLLKSIIDKITIRSFKDIEIRYTSTSKYSVNPV